MRTNNNLTKKSVKKAASILILAVCFALVFTLTITVGLTSSIDGTPSFVAQAWSKKVDGEQTYGVANPIDVSDIAAKDLFTAQGVTATSWSQTANLSGIPLSGSEEAGPSNAQLWKNDGDTALFIQRNESGNKTSTSLKLGVLDAAAAFRFGFAMTYRVPAHIMNLVQNTNFTVKAQIIFDFIAWSSNTNIGDGMWHIIRACDSDNIPTAQSYNGYSGMSNQGTTLKTEINTNEVTLSSGQNCISFGIAFSPTMRVGGRDRWVEIDNLKLKFTVLLNSANDNANTFINDGSEPVKVSQALGASESWTEYPFIIPGSGNSRNIGGANSVFGSGSSAHNAEVYHPYTTDVSRMPIYYSQIANYLNSYKDNRAQNGDVSLNSYFSSPRTVPDKSGTDSTYRKFAGIEYADTFNYESGGINSPFKPGDANSDYFKYAGIGGYTLSNNKWIYQNNDRANRMASGIKSVTIRVTPTGDWNEVEHTFNMYETTGENAGNAWWKIKATPSSGSGELYVGWARVVKNSRANVYVELYLDHNATVDINVKDYGGSIGDDGTITPNEGVSTIVDFKGIDTTEAAWQNMSGNNDDAKKTSLGLDGYYANTPTELEPVYEDNKKIGGRYWYKRNLFDSEMSSGEEDSDDASPYLWFYSVRKTDSFEDLKNLSEQAGFNTIDDLYSSGSLPIAYGALNSFTYDFEKGYAIVSGVGSEQYNAGNRWGLQAATGVGYYAFTFYKVDIAGNVKGEVATQYVKVDYIQPQYNVDFSYKETALSDPTVISNIYATYDKADWAKGESTLTLSIRGKYENNTFYPGLNLSGNFIRFEDADNEYMLSFDRTDGSLRLFGPKGEVTARDSQGRIVLKISTYIDSTEIYIGYTVNTHGLAAGGTTETVYDGTITVTFQGATNNKFPTVAWMTGFNVGTVNYPSIAEADNDDSSLFAESMPEAKIFIDRNLPDMPYLTDSDAENSYIVGNSQTGEFDYTVGSERNWKTDNYNLDATLNFNDFVADIDLFAQYIKVYSVFKNVQSLEELAELKKKNMASIYTDIFDNATAQGAGFDRLLVSDMSRLSNGSAAFPIEFVASNGTGMRVIYLWVVDQAGHHSKLYTAYVLVDTNTYSVSSDMIEAVIGDVSFGKNGTIAQSDDDKVARRTFKRGEQITFNVSLEAGYVPYLFNRSGETILENYTHRKTMVKPEDGKFNDYVTFNLGSDDGKYVITFTLDDADLLNAMDTSISFGMSARKVVTKIVGANKYYDANFLDMKKHVTIPEDESAIDYLTFGYYNSASLDDKFTGTTGTPLNVGTYYVTVDIPRDNVAFVMTPSEKEIGAGTLVPTQFNIVPGRVIITPNVSESVYGNEVELTFSVSGFDFEGGVAPVTREHLNYDSSNLKLNGVSWGAVNNMINVGQYRITFEQAFTILKSDGTVSDNFDVIFTENVIHTVTQRRIDATVNTESKYYGDSDPDIHFAVDPAQFSWYTGDKKALIDSIFTTYGTGQEVGGLYLYNSLGRITRAPGENAGTYAYLRPSVAFDISNNYTLQLILNDSNAFIIEKRPVVLNIADLSSVIPYDPSFSNAPDPTEIVINYALSGADVRFASEIAGIVGGRFVIGSPSFISMSEGDYSGRYVYPVSLQGINSDNFIITLNASSYTVYVAAQNVVIIKLKDNVNITFTYGVKMSDSIIAFSKDMFDVISDTELNFNTVNWEVSIGSFATGDYIPAGKYTVVISNAKLDNNSDAAVTVERFVITVNPAEIVIAPSSTNNTKVYGDDEKFFGFEYSIQSIGGVSFSTGMQYAGLGEIQIRDNISGAYARGRYDKNGNLRYIGEKYDDVTDANGNILRGVEGDYYSYAVRTAFTYAGSNFVVNATHNHEKKFYINPRSIDLSVDYFVGKSKAYDGTSSVNFGNTLVYDLAGLLARSTDDVVLGYDAIYNKIGSMGEKTPVGIIFHNLRLVGDDAINYRLRNINRSNNNVNKLYKGEMKTDENGNTVIVGAEQNSFENAPDIYVVIYYIDNTITENIDSNLIYITLGAIAVFKSDFVISKEYDGTSSIGKEDVTIENRPDANGGTTMLNQLWNTGKASITSVTEFGGKDAGAYVVTRIVIRFEIAGFTNIKDINIANIEKFNVGENGKEEDNPAYDPAYADPDITFEKVQNTNALAITIENLNATIRKKALGVNSFTSISPVDQDYSGQAGNGIVKNTETVLAPGQVVDGDVLSVNVVTKINDGSFDAGVHTVEFVEMGSVKDADKSSVSNPNYTVDVDALNKYYSGDNALKVNINKAKLRPNIKFADMEYNGVAKLNVPTNPDKIANINTDFVTDSFTAELESELNDLHIGGSVEYYLSANGEENPNVVTDVRGNVIAHNVLVRGLSITTNREDLLKNYVMAGGKYNGSGYDEVNAVRGAIEEYEIIGAIKVSRKTLRLLSNNLVIKDKVYDGTRNADITITLNLESGIVNEEQASHLRVSANGVFERGNVGDNIPVNISDVKLVAEEGFEALLNNYVLPYFSERRNANILPRPVAVTNVDLASKTYNGTTAVGANLVEFSLGDMMGNDKDGYSVQVVTGYAQYIDKNVNLLPDGTIGSKLGTIYNPILRNSRGKVNYELVIATDTKQGEDYIAYVDGGVIYYGEKYNGGGNVVYYYALPTADKYISSEEYKTLSEENKKFVAGAYVLDGKVVYLMDSSYTGTAKPLGSTLTYVTGYGKINQRAVSVSPSMITITNDAVRSKLYDGTKKFFGVERDEANGIEGDYYYTQGGIIGNIEGDDVHITGVVAEFETAYTTANYIVFTPSGIDGADKDNYRIDGKIGTARLPGRIYSRTIDADLANGEMEYGTALNMIVGDITYNVHGNPTTENPEGEKYKLTEWEGALYLPMSQYTAMMGFELGSYQDALMTRIYKINRGEDGNGFVGVDENGKGFVGFDKVDENSIIPDEELKNGEYYVRLSGIYSLPKARATFAKSNPTAGEVSTSYTLSRADADNYVFNPVYHKEVGAGETATTSVLTVAKKDLYVATVGKSYYKYYAGNEPEVELYFLDKNGNNGFAPSENAFNVFRSNANDYSPIVKWGIFNTVNKTWVTKFDGSDGRVYKYAEYSSKLKAGEVYMAYFVLPENALGENGIYATNERIRNYNILIGNNTFADGENGTIKMSYEKGDFKSTTSKLTIMEPTISGVTLRAVDNNTYNYTYEKDRDYAANVLYGIRATDTVTIGDYKSVVDAGIYTGKVKVQRKIKVDANDPNEYFNTWSSEETVTINIAKASSLLNVVTSSKYYDGEKFEYETSGDGNMITYRTGGVLHVADDYADIYYEVLNADGEYVRVDEMRNAGTYRVTVAFNEKFAAENKNYIAETATATFSILKAIVTVDISADGYTDGGVANGERTLISAYEPDKAYAVGYSITNSTDTPDGLKLTKEQTELEIKGNIASAGRYPFEIKLKEGTLDINNYRLVNAKGIIELTTKSVENGNASVKLDTETVVNRLVAKEIFEGKGNGSDIELWSAVKSYMPYIDKNASLASVVRLELYCDNNYVEYGEGNIDVSVAIPSEVGSLDGKAIYVVTRDGNLKRLENYSVNNGRIEYNTDYLGAIVFIDLTPSTLPAWLIAVICVSVALFVIAVAWTVVAVVVRKSKLKQLI